MYNVYLPAPLLLEIHGTVLAILHLRFQMGNMNGPKVGPGFLQLVKDEASYGRS